jgi:hypothetical protein
MDDDTSPTERIQLRAVRVLATHPAGRGLCLVGGFRYRLLNESARASNDIDYHWEGDLQAKQMEIWDSVMALLQELLAKAKEFSP